VMKVAIGLVLASGLRIRTVVEAASVGGTPSAISFRASLRRSTRCSRVVTAKTDLSLI
jgi:hypothetical protein